MNQHNAFAAFGHAYAQDVSAVMSATGLHVSSDSVADQLNNVEPLARTFFENQEDEPSQGEKERSIEQLATSFLQRTADGAIGVVLARMLQADSEHRSKLNSAISGALRAI